MSSKKKKLFSKSNQLIILYKNNEVGLINPDKLKEKHINYKTVKYILVPAFGKPNVFYIIKPSKLLLAKRFKVSMTIDASMVDYEESLVSYIDSIDSSIDTKSMVEFVNFMATLYKINGFAELLESSALDMCYAIQSFYPTEYHVEFFDDKDNLMDSINSGKLEITRRNLYTDECPVNFIVQDRMDPLEDILFNISSATKSIHDLPFDFHLDGNYWRDSVKLSQLKGTDIILFYLKGFGAYFLLDVSTINQFIKLHPCRMLSQVHGSDRRDDAILKRLDKLSEYDRISIGEHIENNEFDNYTLLYEFNLADLWTNTAFFCFGSDIVMYLRMIAFLMEDCESKEFSDYRLVMFDATNRKLYIDTEIQSGKLKEAIVQQIFESLEEDQNYDQFKWIDL